MDLRETEEGDSIALPADLTNTQRKFVHELARRLGLESKSHGKGEERRVVVTKASKRGGGITDYGAVPRVDVGKKGEEALKRHLLRFPPSKKEEAEAIETGSSLLFDETDEENEENEGAAPPKAARRKRNDERRRFKHEEILQRRIRCHEQAQQRTKAHPRYQIMMEQRRNLPAFGYAQDVCLILRNTKNRVVILTGDTGCG